MRKFFLGACLLLASCAPAARQTASPFPAEPTFLAPDSPLESPSAGTLDANVAEARSIMTQFFSALNTGDYVGAVSLYEGSYDTLTTWNPDVAASDLITLWQRGCEQNGLQCLQVLEVIDQQAVSANVIKFRLHFRNPDGTLFVLGPCCGENATTMPPVSDFECDVARTSSGEFKVLCLPPYVP